MRVIIPQQYTTRAPPTDGRQRHERTTSSYYHIHDKNAELRRTGRLVFTANLIARAPSEALALSFSHCSFVPLPLAARSSFHGN